MSGKLLFKNIETETRAFSLAQDSKNTAQSVAFSRILNSTLATPLEGDRPFNLFAVSGESGDDQKPVGYGKSPDSPSFQRKEEIPRLSDEDLMARVRAGEISKFKLIFGEISKRVKAAIALGEANVERVFALVESAELLFQKLGSDARNLRQTVAVAQYESFFRDVFSTKTASLVFLLACMELSYAQKVSKNFRLLVRFLVEDPTQLEAWTYVRLFLRLSYFVMAQHQSLCSALKKRDPGLSKTSEGRGLVLRQLEKLPEFAAIIKLNRFDLFRQKKAHYLNSRVNSTILQSLKLTGSFPLAQFDLLNKNLARVFFHYFEDGPVRLPSGLFWQGAIHALNMFPDAPVQLAASASLQGLRELTRLKAIDQLLREFSTTKPAPRFASKHQLRRKSVLETFQFRADLNDVLVSNDTLMQVERFSCYEKSEFEAHLNRLRNSCLRHVDPTVFLFKALFGASLRGFYFYKRLAAQHPNFAQIGLLRAAASAFKNFLTAGVKLGHALGKYSRAMAVNTNDILGLIGQGQNLTQSQRKGLISTVVKVKKAYESVFGYLDTHRKLFDFVKASQRLEEPALHLLMSKFVF